MDLKFYLSIFVRRWWIIALTVLLVTGFTYHRTSKMPVTYVAQARLLYEANNVAASVLGSTGMFYPMSWNNPVETQLSLVKTRPNIEEVIKRLNLKKAPEEIMGGLSAEVDRNTDIIVVRYTTFNPDKAVDIVNEVGRVFVERNKSNHQETARTTREFIEEQLAKTERMLTEAEDEVRHFRETNEVFDIGSIGGSTASQLSAIDTNLIQMEIDRKVAQSKLDNAKRHLALTDPSIVNRLERLRADKVFETVRDQLAGREADLEVLKTRYTADAPELVAAQTQLDKLKGVVQQRARIVLGRELDASGLTGETPTEARYMSDLVEAETELTVLEARASAIKGSRSTYEERFRSLPSKDQQMSRLLRRQQAAEQTYNVFLKRMQEIRITEAMSAGNVRMVEEAARVAARREGAERALALSALVGLVFGLGIALLLEFLDDRIRRPEEAQNVLELPILGMLPWIEGREAAKRRLVVLDDPRSPVTESYRALQTYTRMVEPDTHLQCFLLTSPGPKEGKSTVLANLAVTSAQLGKRTLIVDTDLRAPCQHINFDRPNLTGIYDVVYEGMDLEEAVQETDVDNLDILTTGPVPPDPVQTLHHEAFLKMLDKLKHKYDAIFFDSPPINMFTDAAVLGRKMDSVLLVVDVRSTTRNSTLTAKDLLTKAKVPLAGMVVKNTAQRSNKYHNRYYERYYMDRLKNIADD